MPDARSGDTKVQMRVLLVDDHSDVRALARCYVLAEADAEVVEADNGPAAAAAVREAGFDLVVVDFHMPGMDGLETTRRILAERPGTAVVAWTSVIDQGVESRFVEAGALRHVPKTETDLLRAVIRERCSASTAPPASAAA